MNDISRGIHTYMIYGLYDKMNVESFHQYLIDGVDILAYWNHLPLLYFVKSKSGVNDIAAKIRPFFNGNCFIVQEVLPNAADGWLPALAWEWFRTPAPELKVPAPPPGSLAALLAPTPK